jgi:hypothetical protein
MATRRETSGAVAITAQNVFTTLTNVRPGDRVGINGVSASFVGTASIQRSFDGSQTFEDVTDDQGAVIEWVSIGVQASYVADAACDLRLGVKTGNFTSGTFTAELRMG